jgi:hypothetical protein
VLRDSGVVRADKIAVTGVVGFGGSPKVKVYWSADYFPEESDTWVVLTANGGTLASSTSTLSAVAGGIWTDSTNPNNYDFKVLVTTDKKEYSIKRKVN